MEIANVIEKLNEIKDDELKDLLKEYIKIKDEISYLNDVLEDVEMLIESIEHIKRDTTAIKAIIPKLSKYTNIPMFNDLIKMIDYVDSVETSEIEALRWKINKDIEELEEKLSMLEKEINIRLREKFL
ncbi:hypothetical protein J422_05359 [Methanocaldococcus villosus KIN24-T80]|uniref:Uncharacterized protein n=1 Tax=Methanocaldococcus villosus KIN24-T80 TaxID=1069083 RepID=N6VRW8_9EURY|nr:hypothetical protein [Methanocaldococcus villosus]ENN95906.1 hypothetical protein J422_05359 [Methanocaldococcus villosus KIN24-T80]